MAITCVGLIPAEETVDASAGLNVLVMAVNSEKAEASAMVSLFGSSEREVRMLCTKECTLAAGEHAHLYFHIPKECFQASFWGEECEEMTLYAGVNTPQTSGNLVFIQL